MSWITSLFSNKRTYDSKRGQALSSTHEAFSIPTSSPGYPNPDALNGDAFHDSDSVASPSYTYPPPPLRAPMTLRPHRATTGDRQSTLLPLHYQGPPTSKPLYPPLEQTWARLRTWLSREYPELGDTLNWGILPEDLAQVEMQFGFDLPSAVRESYLTVDGQEPESAAGCSEGLFFGLTLLPLEDVLDEWRFWREVDDDPNTGANARLRESMRSVPAGWIRNEYSSRGWIPLVADKAGNYLGVDVAPGDGGAPGQVIIFGRDYDTKVVLWRGDGPGGWAKWLASFAEDLESGEGFEVGISSDGSEGSEDDVGYEGYFFDGAGPGGGGSEGNAGGLRLTGEYRGWNILDAWADRSIRRWHEAGVHKDDPALPPTRDKRQSGLGLGVINLEGASGAEVPIPVLVEHSTDNLPPIPEDEKQPATPPPVPTISVTKAPAPQPVLLPTEHDIAPYSSDVEDPEEEYSSVYRDGDLEAGQGHKYGGASAPRVANVETREESASSLPSATSPGTPSNPAVPSRVEIPDLLADDTAPELSATPIEPSPSPSHSSKRSEDARDGAAASTATTANTTSHSSSFRLDDEPSSPSSDVAAPSPTTEQKEGVTTDAA